MDGQLDSTMPRRRLGLALKELRERAGITQDAAGVAVNGTRYKIWRIEKGQVPVKPNDVKVLCNLYQAGPRITQGLAGLASATDQPGWWHAYGDSVPTWFSLYVGLENAASRIRILSTNLVPGLLQTKRYATAMYTHHSHITAEEGSRAVEVRMQRQTLLTRQYPEPPEVEVVLCESVLRRALRDRAAMADQLRHLAVVGERANVTIRVLALDTGPTLANEAAAFVLLDFPTGKGRGTVHEPSTVYQEGLTGALYLNKPNEVEAYEKVWNVLDAHAWHARESRDLILRIAGEMEDHHA